MAGTTTLGAWRASIPTRVAAAKKAAVLHLWTGATKRTPVDTGRARAAWNIATDSPDLSTPGAAPRGGRIPAPAPPVIGEIPTGSPAIVSNNLPYIGELEKGSSSKAPNGMARLAFEATTRAMRGIVNGVRRQFER